MGKQKYLVFAAQSEFSGFCRIPLDEVKQIIELAGKLPQIKEIVGEDFRLSVAWFPDFFSEVDDDDLDLDGLDLNNGPEIVEMNEEIDSVGVDYSDIIITGRVFWFEAHPKHADAECEMQSTLMALKDLERFGTEAT